MGARAYEEKNGVEESVKIDWTPIQSLDYSPRKKETTYFTDYRYKEYVICDYVNCWHVFKKHKYVVRVKTLRQAKRVVRWLEGEKYTTPRKKGIVYVIKWSI